MNPVRNSQWYVYVLYSKKNDFLYTGCTNNIKNRVKEHNNGKVLSTKSRLPLILIYTVPSYTPESWELVLKV